MPYIKSYRIFIALLLFFSSSAFFSNPVWAEEIDCLSCHEPLATGTSVHQAISFGCATCHIAVDASVLPHKITNRHPRGLSSRQKQLCYSCHERTKFMKQNVHGAILLGCTSCHNPHASEQARLLKEPMPQLCVGCHEEAPIIAKAPHDSIGDALCSTCHAPHASDNPKLLISGYAPADSSHIAQSVNPSRNN